MKRTTLAASIALAALFSASTQASMVTYTESGSDGLGDSFSITFQYDNVNDVVTGVTAGSFTDASGTYTGVNNIDFNGPFIGGYVVQVNDPSYSDFIGIALNTANTPPTPTPSIFGYAGTDSAGVGGEGIINYNNGSEVTLVPEPSILATLFAGLIGLATAARGKKRQD